MALFIDFTGDNPEIIATDGDDIVFALGGDDIVYAGDGADLVFGGSGNDTIYGQGGNDVLIGGTGGDILEGGDGNDILLGGADADVLNGGAGDDILAGGSGGDTYIFDTLSGNDLLFGWEQGVDTLDLSGTTLTADNFNLTSGRLTYDDVNDTLTIQLDDAGNSNLVMVGIDDAELASLLSGADVILAAGGGCVTQTGTAGVDTFTFGGAGDPACLIIDGFDLGALNVGGDGDWLDLSAIGLTNDAIMGLAPDNDPFTLIAVNLEGQTVGDWTFSFDTNFLNKIFGPNANIDTDGDTSDDLSFTATNGDGDVITLTILGVDTIDEVSDLLFGHTTN